MYIYHLFNISIIVRIIIIIDIQSLHICGIICDKFVDIKYKNNKFTIIIIHGRGATHNILPAHTFLKIY